MGPPNEYRFILDERYIADSMRHFRRMGRFGLLGLVLKTLCYAGLALLAALMLSIAWREQKPDALLFTGIPLFFAVLLAVAPRLDGWLSLRRLRASPAYRSELAVSVAEPGVNFASPQFRTELAWSVFNKAVRLSDGYIVYFNRRATHWWPDRALVSGSAGEVGRLIESHMPLKRRDLA